MCGRGSGCIYFHATIYFVGIHPLISPCLWLDLSSCEDLARIGGAERGKRVLWNREDDIQKKTDARRKRERGGGMERGSEGMFLVCSPRDDRKEVGKKVRQKHKD